MQPLLNVHKNGPENPGFVQEDPLRLYAIPRTHELRIKQDAWPGTPNPDGRETSQYWRSEGSQPGLLLGSPTT